MRNILILPAVLFLLTSCSQTQMNDITSSIGNTLGSLVSVGTDNDSQSNNEQTKSTSNNQKKSNPSLGEFSLTVPQDIDTVFAAVINEFQFPSPQVLKKKFGSSAEWHMKDGYYHYDMTPGAYYHLGYGYLKHKGESIAIEMKLMKSGNGTKIMTEYRYSVSSQTVKNEIIARIKKALK